MGYLVLLYGIFILTGGVWGYLRANSLPSLLMGTLFGVLLIASAYGLTRHRDVGRFSALGLTILLSFFFLYRFIISWKFMPTGLLAIISISMLVALAFTRKQTSASSE